MTTMQKTGVISVSVSALICIVLVMIWSSLDRKYTRQQLKDYDETVTKKQEQLWDTTNARLLRISKQLENE